MARKAKADPNQTRMRNDLYGIKLDEMRTTSTKKSGSDLFAAKLEQNDKA